MSVHKTDDLEAVARILNHPRVFRMLADDSTPSPYVPTGGFHVMNDAKTGVVRIDPMNGICCVVHIAAMPELWGKANEFAMDVITWGFENTLFVKAVAMIPKFNRLTINLCLDCGFVLEGRLIKAFQKNWEYHDLVILGLTKTDFYKKWGSKNADR